jgi:hypothetical protein
MNLRPLLRKLFFKRADKIHGFFYGAVRVYILKGEEDARCAAVAAAEMATGKQRKTMVRELDNMAANIIKSYPDKSQRKPLADRVFSLKGTIESMAARGGSRGEEKKNLSILNREYFSCLTQGDSSVFWRRYPKLF